MSKQFSLSARMMMLLVHLLLFCTIYTSTNWYAEFMEIQTSFITIFDTKIPFIPWMIIPYSSSLLLFLLAFNHVKINASLHQLNQNLTLAILIAGWIYYFYPMSFGVEKGHIDYPWRIGFDFLHLVDKPYNQMPSLHVIYGVILWASLINVFKVKARIMLSLYIVIMILSTLFVHQHHLIDIISALIISIGLVRFSKRYFLPYPALIYFTLASTCLLLGLIYKELNQLYGWWLGYLSLSCTVIMIAYVTKNPDVLGKNKQGKMNKCYTIITMPYSAIYWLMSTQFYSANKTIEVSVLPWLIVGSRQSLQHTTEALTHIIDLGAELPLVREITERSRLAKRGYISFPLLDLQPITITQAVTFCQLVDSIPIQAETDKTAVLLYVHCTMGISRSYAMIASYLVWSGKYHAADVKGELLHLNQHIMLSEQYLPFSLLAKLAQISGEQAKSDQYNKEKLC